MTIIDGDLNAATRFVKALPFMRDNGYDPFAIYAQCHLETGNFTCKASTEHNNFAGMMPRKDCTASAYDQITHEWVQGKDGKMEFVEVVSHFNHYPSVMDFLLDYDIYIRGKFPRAYESRSKYRDYFRGLMNIVDLPNGEKKCVYPSFCTSWVYADACIKRYDELRKNEELYLLVRGN